MPSRQNVRIHASIVYPIDELSLGVASDKHGRELELCVHAYGEAEIVYDRDGDWQIIGLQIDGMRRNLLSAPTILNYLFCCLALNNISRKMAGLTVNSKLRMNSGYEIPILGYGVGV